MRGLFIAGTLVGLVLGLAAGLVISWVYWPVSLVDASPADLRLDLKDDYQRMIAATYSMDGDLRRAWARLGALQLDQPVAAVSDLARRESKPLYQQALVRLTLDLQQPAVALARPTYTPRPTRNPPLSPPPATVRPVPTLATAPTLALTQSPVPETPTEERTSIPSNPAPNPDAPRVRLAAKSSLTCEQTNGRAHIEIQVEDENSQPRPGIGVQVSWSGGDEVFYTGLKPERGMGYADLSVNPGSYNVQLIDTAQSEVVENLKIEANVKSCTPQSTEIYGWRLLFRLIPTTAGDSSGTTGK